MSSVMETSTMLPIGYKNRLLLPVSLIIRCYYVIEVCICERDSSSSGLVQRSLIISSPLLYKIGDSPETYSTRRPWKQKKPGFQDGCEEGLPMRNAITGLWSKWEIYSHCVKSHYSGFYICSTYQYLWRRQWQPTSVLLPGKSHGKRSLVGCSPWGC